MRDLMFVYCICIYVIKSIKGKGELVKSLVVNSFNEEIKLMIEWIYRCYNKRIGVKSRIM